MKLRILPFTLGLILATSQAFSDDGAINNKNMSRNAKLTVTPEEVGETISEAEHAFIDTMKFYVPMQSASGDNGTLLDELEADKDPRDYYNIDEELVETLDVAQPLVSVFIYGPTIGVDGTPFGHSFMDTFGSVSLDDGVTWKTVNLSESADKSSFNLASTSSTVSSDDNDADDADDGGLRIEEAELIVRPLSTKLKVEGEGALLPAMIEIINGETQALLFKVRADTEGEFEAETRVSELPCTVSAKVGEDISPAVHVENAPADCVGHPGGSEGSYDLTEYPGGVSNVFHAVVGNKVLVAWPSTYCKVGQPAYSFAYDGGDDTDLDAKLLAKREGLAGYLGIDVAKDLYLTDLFDVSGSQLSSDFAEEGYPQAGEVPFRCVWTARGVLVDGDDPRTTDVEEATHMEWFKAERLTSGKRDPNRIEVKGVEGAGFAITWQEDPEGLRPGDGEGPGEGWSGAVAHHKTDVWYSFINWENFDLVEVETEDDTWSEPINLADYIEASVAAEEQLTKAQPGVPMAVPVRITNNAKCVAPIPTDPTDPNYFSYCNYAVAASYGLKNNCATTVDTVTSKDKVNTICVTEDGIPLVANTASTRPRLGLKGFDSDGDGAVDSAWAVFASEESKGLGAFFFYADTGEACTEGDPARTVGDYTYLCEEADIGKNQWYYSYNMGEPATSANLEKYGKYSLVANVVSQGNLLNQPEVDWRTGEYYPVLNTVNMWNFSANGGTDFDMYNTEIARRASLLIQGIGKAQASENGLLVMSSWKQGAMNQGGPADTMLRRIVLPDGYGDDTGGVCSIDENIDVAQPVVTDAFYKTTSTGAARLIVTVTGYDGDAATKIRLRNAVNLDDYGYARSVDETGDFIAYAINADTWTEIPCAIQAADWDGTPQYGPWIAISNPNAIPGGCVGAIPTACSDDIATLAATPTGTLVNPYDFENMVCDTWLVGPGENPYYPGGVCGTPATNLSAVVPDTCVDSADGSTLECPVMDYNQGTFGVGSLNPIIQGKEIEEPVTTKVLTWHQCPSGGVAQPGSDIDATLVSCESGDSNLADQSWYNPLDVSKGHRGFIDGDFVMILYAWSPNWRLNKDGHDRYELYVRRSFDGGNTWTTTPSSFKASNGEDYSGDGTVTCESYRSADSGTSGEVTEPKVCYDFPAGGAEHARNVTQHKSMRITTLDPRYAISGSTTGVGIPAEDCFDALDPTTGDAMTCDDGSELDDTDLRDPSRYFMVFETGDNSTVSEGEAEPLDLNYSRGINFGDDYAVWAEETDLSVCYPSDPHLVDDVSEVIIDSGFCNEFDNMNTGGDTHSSEASLAGNSNASKLYGVWTQWVFDEAGEEEIESDAMARRVWWIEDYIPSDENAWTLPGTSGGTDSE